MEKSMPWPLCFLIIQFLDLLYITCMNILPACMSVHYVCSWYPKMTKKKSPPDPVELEFQVVTSAVCSL